MEKKKLFLYCAAGCILLGLIMALLNTFSMSTPYGSGGVGMTDKLAVFKILIILLDLAAIAALLLPMFGVLADKAALLRLCAIGAAVLSVILFIIALLVAKNEVSEANELLKTFGDFVEDMGYDLNKEYSIHFSFVGWLLLIFHLGGAALAFLESKEK